MDLGIAGRRAAVAAGTAGLGLGVARALAAEGVSVAVCGRDPDRLDDAVASLRAASAPGVHCVGLAVDLANSDQAAAFIDDASNSLDGPIDILVPNAGGPPPGDALTTSLDAYRAAWELNCASTMGMCQAAVPAMQSLGWGRVVAITSVGAREPIGYLAASSAARAAVTSFLKVLARQVAPDGVTVNSLQPGIHATDRIASLSAEGVDELRTRIPVGVPGRPEHFGAVATFMCSEHARFVTGVAVPVDGGASHGLT